MRKEKAGAENARRQGSKNGHALHLFSKGRHVAVRHVALTAQEGNHHDGKEELRHFLRKKRLMSKRRSKTRGRKCLLQKG
jgi:hypothetical protein